MTPRSTPSSGTRRWLLAGLAALAMPWAAHASESADAFIRRITGETLQKVKADRSLREGNVNALMKLVDSQVMPHVNFRRMTALSVGPAWRRATPEQQARLQEEFKLLLVRTYAGALSQVSDQTVLVKPPRAGQEDSNLVVSTEVRGGGGGEPIRIDYRLEKSGDAWQIFDLNVLGVWLVENYRTQFAQSINAGGVDALIQALSERNKSARKT
ncbi:MAG: putative phospholipid-binding protein MlaC precursor [Pseudomonadota bacterium]